MGPSPATPPRSCGTELTRNSSDPEKDCVEAISNPPEPATTRETSPEGLEMEQECFFRPQASGHARSSNPQSNNQRLAQMEATTSAPPSSSLRRFANGFSKFHLPPTC